MDVRPGLTGLLDHGREVLEPHRVVIGSRPEAILRRPARGAHEIPEAHGPSVTSDLLHDDHGVAADAARAGRELSELPPGEVGGLGTRLQLLAKRSRPSTAWRVSP